MKVPNIVLKLSESSSNERIHQVYKKAYRELYGEMSACEYLYDVIAGENDVEKHISSDEMAEMIHSLSDYYMPGMMIDYKRFYGEEIYEDSETPADLTEVLTYKGLIEEAIPDKDVIIDIDELQLRSKNIWNKFKELGLRSEE